MNKKDRIRIRNENYKQYHIPGCPNYVKRPRNAIYISPGNSLKHELKKLEICYELQKNGSEYITEAVRNKKDHEGKYRRVDIVELDTGYEYEIETDPRRAKRFEGEHGVIVIKCWGDKNVVEKKERN
jgi:hypothetical protein